MAELVDALVSGTSGESRGGSSPLLSTNSTFRCCSCRCSAKIKALGQDRSLFWHQGFAAEAVVRPRTLNSIRSLKRSARTPKNAPIWPPLPMPWGRCPIIRPAARVRSEEHTSELQSPCNLVCRLLLEKKKKKR